MPDIADLKGLMRGLVTALGGATRLPSDTRAIRDFDMQRYLGTWYEIARLDHRFERGLSHVTARYETRSGGAIDVINRGYAPADDTWDEARDKARFETDDPRLGRLRVTFFGPFYAGYHILWIDDAYAHALVAGPTHDYLWLLALELQPARADYALIQNKAAASGFDTDGRIRVAQGERD